MVFAFTTWVGGRMRGRRGRGEEQLLYYRDPWILR